MTVQDLLRDANRDAYDEGCRAARERILARLVSKFLLLALLGFLAGFATGLVF